MATKQGNKESTSGFPPGLAQPALRALAAAGYTHLEQLAKVKESDLRNLHGIGPKALNLLGSALEAKGLSFAAADVPPAKKEVIDNPSGWVKSHIQEYVESDGQNGYLWHGVPTLLLTMLGRKSGKYRRTALIFGRDGKDYLVVASKGGAPDHPNWYLNLMENPEVEIQVQAEKLKVRARKANAEEKPRLWQIMSTIWPQYNDYQTKTDREIPVVILSPIK